MSTSILLVPDPEICTILDVGPMGDRLALAVRTLSGPWYLADDVWHYKRRQAREQRRADFPWRRSCRWPRSAS